MLVAIAAVESVKLIQPISNEMLTFNIFKKFYLFLQVEQLEFCILNVVAAHPKLYWVKLR